jgi:hypothetical protein
MLIRPAKNLAINNLAPERSRRSPAIIGAGHAHAVHPGLNELSYFMTRK